ncbi:MAG: hypothetical protein HN509_12125, partial [Halobacteriovoraceae bacterium]|nr:hypothetical protein [Halobacteriovoraceae bacterium]
MDNKTAFTNAFSPINFVVGTSLFLLPVVAMLNVWSDADMVVKLGLLGLAGLGLYFLSRSSESLLKVLENGFEVDETVGGAGFNWEFATPLKKEWQDYVIILSP